MWDGLRNIRDFVEAATTQMVLPSSDAIQRWKNGDNGRTVSTGMRRPPIQHIERMPMLPMRQKMPYIGGESLEYPGSVDLQVDDTPDYPEFLTRPQRAFYRNPPAGPMHMRQIQPAMPVIDIADEGGAMSPQVQRETYTRPIQPTGQVMPADTINPMRIRTPRQLPGIRIQ